MISSETPMVCRIRGKLFTVLCVNNILIICDLSFPDKSLCQTEMINLNFFLTSIIFDVL